MKYLTEKGLHLSKINFMNVIVKYDINKAVTQRLIVAL